MLIDQPKSDGLFPVEAVMCNLAKPGPKCPPMAKFFSRFDCETFAKRMNSDCDERNPQVAVCRPRRGQMGLVGVYSCPCGAASGPHQHRYPGLDASPGT